MNKIDGLKNMINDCGFETRTFKNSSELRAAFIPEAVDGEARKLEGYAAVTDLPSDDIGGFIEVIARGAFNNCDFSNCKGLWNHNDDIVLASISAGTLKLEVNERGLFYSMTPPDNDYVNSVVISTVSRGDVDKSSFRFIAGDDEWSYDASNDICYRHITSIKEVLDVSPVTFPAYSFSSAVLRSADKARNINAASFDKERLSRESFLNNLY